jgi:hypothetical protein
MKKWHYKMDASPEGYNLLVFYYLYANASWLVMRGGI